MRHCTHCGASTPDDARFCPGCGAAVNAGSGDPMLGKVIADRYLLVEKIGQGGSGIIYRGEHTTLRKKVAVKILHAQLSRDDSAIERFRREATTVAELDNDHILQVLDFGRTDDQRLFFAMELLEGETLTKVLEREKALTIPRTIDILMQIAEALMEAHGLGYVHRDLRPRNVFLIQKRGRNDFVKLLDFGLAKLVLPNSDAKQTAMGMTFGDPRYMSPEQARGEAFDRRSDIYSLGSIAFEMLTGAPPFTGSGTFEILQKALDAPVPRVRERRSDCPEWLDAVVQRALAKKPEGRFLTVLRMIECLRAQTEPGAVDAAEQAAHARLTAERPVEPGLVAPVAGGEPSSPVRKIGSEPSARTTTIGMVPVMVAPAASAKARSGPTTSEVQMGSGPVAAAVEPQPAPKLPRETQAMAAIGSGRSGRPSTGTLVDEPRPPLEASPPAPVAVPRPVASAPQPSAPSPSPSPSPGNALSASVAPAAAGSLEVTPTSVRVELDNVPSVVVESTSQDKTVPARPPQEPHAPITATQPAIEAQRPSSRPPTGEWFSTDSQPTGLVGPPGAVYDEFEDAPRPNRGPLIIGGVAGGLALVVIVIIAMLPKPQHKPLRGEQATPEKPAAVAASAAPASGSAPVAAAPATPSGNSVQPSPLPPAPDKPVAAAPPEKAPAPESATVKEPPAIAAKPAVKEPPPAPAKPPAPEPKPAAVAATKPAPKEPAAQVEKVDKAKASPTKVAATPGKPSSSSSSIPEGFKDPFADGPKGEAAQAEFFVKLGRQKLNSSDLSAAAANFNKAREYDARSADAVAGLGEVAFEQGDYSGAAVHLKQALRLSPNRARYLVLLGQTYYKLGKPRDAVGEYKKALRLDPGNQEAQHSLEVAERKLQSGG